MIESPWLEEILEEANAAVSRRSMEEFLTSRFDRFPDELKKALQEITDPDRLRDLIRWAARCPDLAAFRARL